MDKLPQLRTVRKYTIQTRYVGVWGVAAVFRKSPFEQQQNPRYPSFNDSLINTYLPKCT